MVLATPRTTEISPNRKPNSPLLPPFSVLWRVGGGFPSRPILHVVADRIFFSISHQPRHASTPLPPRPRGNCAPFYPAYVLRLSHRRERRNKKEMPGKYWPPCGPTIFSPCSTRVRVAVCTCTFLFAARPGVCVCGAHC